MPNHVTIIMNINGSKDVVDEFLASHIGTGNSKWEGAYVFLDFNSLIPMPEELDVGNVPIGNPTDQMQLNTDKYGYSSWYDWCVDKWGTKWNSYDCSVERVSDEHAVIRFQTAWSLPYPVFAEIAELYPELNWQVDCVEEGGFFAGQLIYTDGQFEDLISEDGEVWREYASNIYGYRFDENGEFIDDEEDYIVGETEPTAALPTPEQAVH